MKKNSFVEGTFIATIAIIIVKILGALYVIPFYSIIGEQGGALYSYAYNIYNLFLNISTAGLPLAISKIISEYNSLELYEAKERTFKIAKKIMLIISVVAFFLLFVFASEFATLIIGDIEGGNTLKDVELVIRTVSFCLLIIPYLSALKGYLQGHKFISATSISQVLEQVVRIAIILFGSYLAINIFNQSISIGVSVAVSGAFIGGLVAYIYLQLKINKNKKEFKVGNELIKNTEVTNKEIIKKIITYSVPFIIVSIATDIYSITDLTLIIRGLYYLGYNALEAETIASIISTWGVKICMIINAVAIGLSSSLIPHIVSSYTKKDMKEVNKKLIQSIGIIIAVGLPMTIGISFLSNPVYNIFYGESIYGGMILKYLVFAAFCASIHIVLNMILQSLNKFKIVYYNTIAGLLLNAILDIPLMMLFNQFNLPPFYGAITATIIGYVVSYIIAFSVLKKELKIDYKPLKNIIKKLILPLISMIVILYLTNIFIPLDIDGTFKKIIICLLYAIIGGSLFIFISYKNNLINIVFGETFINKIKSKFKRSK